MSTESVEYVCRSREVQNQLLRTGMNHFINLILRKIQLYIIQSCRPHLLDRRQPSTVFDMYWTILVGRKLNCKFLFTQSDEIYAKDVNVLYIRIIEV